MPVKVWRDSWFVFEVYSVAWCCNCVLENDVFLDFFGGFLNQGLKEIVYFVWEESYIQ